MEINRSNYEIWLIDWLDGNLSNIQFDQLQLFLTENPDLKEEFNDLNTLVLKPSGYSFKQKDQLLRSTTDLYVSQFENLCIAYLENDLPEGQQTELKEIIGKDPEKNRAFELVQKMRLNPPEISYNYKHKLKKRTLIQNVIRLSTIGISAAATVALLIMTYFLIPRNLPQKTVFTAFDILVDSTLSKLSVSIVPEKPVSKQQPVIPRQKNEILTPDNNNGIPEINEYVSEKQFPDDSLFIKNYPEISLNKVPVFTEVNMNETHINNILVASKNILVLPPSDNEQSNVSKFIARTFREKILKEKLSKDSPLKAYEIAEAGVSGLNKLLGWEMALDQKKDANGELSSVYFSSKLLKFNAPVKKNELLP